MLPKEIILYRNVAQQQIVVRCSDAARRQGIILGMSVPHAQALLGNAWIEEYVPERDHKALQVFARSLFSFAPIVGIDHPPPRY